MMTKKKRNNFRKNLMTLSLIGACSAISFNQLRANPINDTDNSRAFVVVKAPNGNLLSFRRLESDSPRLRYSLYRNGQLITSNRIGSKTNFLDTTQETNPNYELQIHKNRRAPINLIKPIRFDNFLEIKLNIPTGGQTIDGKNYTYNANDASIGDLDGDGVPEVILKWDPSNSKDNSQGGFTSSTYIDAYKLSGQQLWRIDLGPNIRSGAHYTQFMLADFDGDGKSELIMKTADGTIDGVQDVIGDKSADWVLKTGQFPTNDRTGSIPNGNNSYNAVLDGRILSGPEYLTLFEGATGKAIDTIPYVPQRGINTDNPTSDEMAKIWGDGYGNRSERYLGAIAYFNTDKPSAIMARGYYARTVIAAFDVRNNKLIQRFVFDSSNPNTPSDAGGQGNHQMSIADIDNDGKHEIIYGAMAIADGGKLIWNSKLMHGDALHVGDIDPSRPGLERFGVHENMRNGNIGAALLDAKTGEKIFTKHAERDTGRGVAADIDPRFLGQEMWAANSNEVWDAKGNKISDAKPNSANFAIWWDGDLSRELLDGNKVSKWDYLNSKTEVIFTAEGTQSNNGTKSTPALSGDFLGDWREEFIMRTIDNTALRIYSTNIPTEYSIPNLMSDRQYRAAIAWQNSAYNQPPHPSFYLGTGMKKR